jgi:hypothetical protein
MKEEGIDLAGVKPQFLSKELAQKANVLVTIGCNRGRATEVARRSEMRALMFPASRNWIGLCRTLRESPLRSFAKSGTKFANALKRLLRNETGSEALSPRGHVDFFGLSNSAKINGLIPCSPLNRR